MRQVYRLLANLIALGVVVQVASIALAWFITLHDLDEGLVLDENFDYNVGHVAHAIGGLMVIPLLALLLMVVSFFAKVDGGVKWAALVLLAVVVQILLAFVSFGLPWLGALHGVNALVVAGLASMAARRSLKGRTRESVAA